MITVTDCNGLFHSICSQLPSQQRPGLRICLLTAASVRWASWVKKPPKKYISHFITIAKKIPQNGENGGACLVGIVGFF